VEVKLLSEKRYWMRVYDAEFEKRIERYYEKSKKQFESKNDFFVTCFNYGLTMLLNANKLEVKEFLKSKDFLLNQKVNQVMLSNIYSLLEYLSIVLKADKEMVETLNSSSITYEVEQIKEKIKSKEEINY